MAYSPIGADEEGNLPPEVRTKLNSIYAPIGSGGGGTAVVTDPNSPTALVVGTLSQSGPDIVGFGDSMTYGSGGAGSSWPSRLATLSGRTVRNAGVPGEDSVTIAARQGGRPFLVTVTGGTIPASGSVGVTFAPIDGRAPNPLNGDSAAILPLSGTLSGVPGTITVSGGYQFTRTASGSATASPAAAVFETAYGLARRGDIQIFCAGQNPTPGASEDRTFTDLAAMINYLTPTSPRYLVMSRPLSNDELDRRFLLRYGSRYISMRQALIAQGLTIAGISATAQDTADIAAGYIPVSLRSDDAHLNAAGYNALGQIIFNKLTTLGWLA